MTESRAMEIKMGIGWVPDGPERLRSATPGEYATEIARLQRDLAEATEAKRRALKVADERSRENVALRAALKPFSRLCDLFPGDWPNTRPITYTDADGDRDLVLGDLRAARAAEQSAETEE